MKSGRSAAQAATTVVKQISQASGKKAGLCICLRFIEGFTGGGVFEDLTRFWLQGKQVFFAWEIGGVRPTQRALYLLIKGLCHSS